MKLKNNTRFLIACLLIVILIISIIIASSTDRKPSRTDGVPAVSEEPVIPGPEGDADSMIEDPAVPEVSATPGPESGAGEPAGAPDVPKNSVTPDPEDDTEGLPGVGGLRPD